MRMGQRERVNQQNEAFESAVKGEPAAETLPAVPAKAPANAFPAAKTWVPPETRREIFDGGREIGQFEGLDFARKIITGVQLGKLANIKENKIYRLSGFQTWDNFCEQILGVSRRMVDDKIEYLAKFGAEFFDAAQQVSMNRKTLRALKALPDDVLKDVVQGKAVVVEGEEIPLDEEHADEINVAVAALVAKYKHKASEEESHSTLAAKENLKLKRELEKKDAQIAKMNENPPGNWVDPLVQKAVELCSEAVVRIDMMSQAANQIEDRDVRERIFRFALSNLDRAVNSFEEAITGLFHVPGVTDAEE